MIRLSTTISLLVICVVISACDTKVATKKNEHKVSSSGPTLEESIKQKANLGFFLDAAEEAFKKLRQSGASLQDAIEVFTQSPSLENLNKAHQALLNTHQNYMLAQLFQKIDIAHPELDLSQNQPEVIHPINIRLDQHPIISGYLDAVPNYPASGLIFAEQELSSEYLNNEHQFSDTAYVAIGFHALELLLTGALSQTPQERSLEFSNLSNTSEKSTAPYRRSRYVQLITRLINDDLKKLSTAWTANEGFYPQTLNELALDESERLIQQTYKIEEHALSQIKEHDKDNHPDAIDERKAQLALILKHQDRKQD